MREIDLLSVVIAHHSPCSFLSFSKDMTSYVQRSNTGVCIAACRSENDFCSDLAAVADNLSITFLCCSSNVLMLHSTGRGVSK